MMKKHVCLRLCALILMISLLIGCAAPNVAHMSVNATPTAGPRVEIGVGGAILSRVPDGMTGREQFHISAALIIPIIKYVEWRTAWDHYSNGAHIGIGRFPNRGFDAGSTQLIFIIK